MTRTQADKVMDAAKASGFTKLFVARRVNGGRNPWCVTGTPDGRQSITFWTKQDWDQYKQAKEQPARV